MPKAIKFQTRHQLALEMLAEQWRVAAAHLDRRRRRDGPAQRFSPGIAWLWANAICWRSPRTRLIRDLEAPPPEYSRTWATAEVSVRACGPMVRGPAGGRLDQDRGA